MDNNSSSIGSGAILFFIFLTLKLMGTINWSWWWVTSPIWIPITIVLLILSIWAFIIILR